MRMNCDSIMTPPEDLSKVELQYIQDTVDSINRTSPGPIIFPEIPDLSSDASAIERGVKEGRPIHVLIVGGELYPPIEEAIYEKMNGLRDFQVGEYEKTLRGPIKCIRYPQDENAGDFMSAKHSPKINKSNKEWMSKFPKMTFTKPDIVLINGDAPNLGKLLETIHQMGNDRYDGDSFEIIPRMYVLTENDGYEGFGFRTPEDGVIVFEAHSGESYFASEGRPLRKNDDYKY